MIYGVIYDKLTSFNFNNLLYDLQILVHILSSHYSKMTLSDGYIQVPTNTHKYIGN